MEHTRNEEADALEHLVASDGWRRFCAHLDAEWGAGGQRFEALLEQFADSREPDAMVLRQIQQVAVARREILRLRDWPAMRVRHLAAAPSDMSPRAALPRTLAGQSRRGGGA